MLSEIEGVVLAGFLSLEPGGMIGPHRDTRDDHMVRCHLGLHLAPCERDRWPELTCRLMDVRASHSARNDGKVARLTLVVDVRRPFRVPDDAFGPWSPEDTAR